MKHLPAIRKGHGHLARTMENPFEIMRHGMGDMFEGLFRDFGALSFSSMNRFWKGWDMAWTKFNVSETEDAYHVDAELPGLEEKDIDISIDRDTLVIRGEKRQESENRRNGRFFSEKSYYRTYTIPWGVDCDKVKAAFRKGVIKVTLPKIEKTKIERKSVRITSD